MSDPESVSSKEYAFDYRPDAVDDLINGVLFGLFDNYFNKKLIRNSLRSSDFRTAMHAATEVDSARHKIESATSVMDALIPREDCEFWFNAIELEYVADLHALNKLPEVSV